MQRFFFLCLSSLLFAFQSIGLAIARAFEIAFSPVAALESLLREVWPREPKVQPPARARQRSFVARILETVDFREQHLGITPSRC